MSGTEHLVILGCFKVTIYVLSLQWKPCFKRITKTFVCMCVLVCVFLVVINFTVSERKVFVCFPLVLVNTEFSELHFLGWIRTELS